MPMFTDLIDSDPVLDLDAVQQRVFTVGAASRIDSMRMDTHRHHKAQLLLVQRGVVTCGTTGGLWVVPVHGALWIPPDMPHDITAAGDVECYMVFVDALALPSLPDRCCTLAVWPLLRELVMRSAEFGFSSAPHGAEARLYEVLLDEIAAAPLGGLYLPMPAEPRIRAIVDAMMADPSRPGTVADWGKRAGLSARTLARVLERETGMSFGRWRRQLAVMLALQWLADGATVQQVAADLGYESAGSFVAMFRKTMGVSPARYVARQG